MAGQPVEGFFKADVVQMDDQIDGAAAADPAVPVDELGTGDREDTLGRVPLALVVRIALGAPNPEDRAQRDGPQLISEFPERAPEHPLAGPNRMRQDRAGHQLSHSRHQPRL